MYKYICIQSQKFKGFQLVWSVGSLSYNSFLEKNGLASIIESVQMQPLGNGWGNFKVKLQGVKEEYNWEMTLGGRR